MLELEIQNPPPPPPKNWLLSHPYTASTLGAVILFLIGSYIVLSKTLVSPPPPSVSAWGGTIGSILNQDYPPAGPQVSSPEDILRQVQDSPPYTYKIPPLKPNPPAPQPATSPDRGLDLQGFITALDESTSETGQKSPSWGSVIYEFPPSNLFNSSEAPAERSELQQKLYNYGNEVGSYIQSFEQQNKAQTQVLKDQIEDRNNPDKIKAVVDLGLGLQNIGANMKGIDEVPPQMVEAHQALIDSYTEIGYNLTLVPKAKNNQEFLSAINIYNESADTFAQKFVEMVNVFTKYNVTFSTQDAGTVFTFTFTTGE